MDTLSCVQPFIGALVHPVVNHGLQYHAKYGEGALQILLDSGNAGGPEALPYFTLHDTGGAFLLCSGQCFGL